MFLREYVEASNGNLLDWKGTCQKLHEQPDIVLRPTQAPPKAHGHGKIPILANFRTAVWCTTC